MNLLKECDKGQVELLQEAGIHIENRDYDSVEIKMISNEILNYIMSKSKKDIWAYQDKYEEVLRKIIK